MEGIRYHMKLTDVISKRVVYGKQAIVADNSSSSAVRITQTGSGNAVTIEDTNTPDSTPLVVNSVGNIIKGSTSSKDVAGFTHGIQLNSSTVISGASLSLLRYNNDATSPQISFAKSRGTGTNFGIVQNGDDLGVINFAADNGSDYSTRTAYIKAEVDGVASSANIPTALRFFAGNNSSPSERLTIRSSGNVGIGEDAPSEKLEVDGNIKASGGIKSESQSQGIGYITGSGGSVTQTTSRSTDVTINKINGRIELVSAAGSGTFTLMKVNNSTVDLTDVIIVGQKSGVDKYEIHVTNIANGSFELAYRTISGSTVEQPVFNFAVIKAVAS